MARLQRENFASRGLVVTMLTTRDDGAVAKLAAVYLGSILYYGKRY